jgi:hypothetical protein
MKDNPGATQLEAELDPAGDAKPTAHFRHVAFVDIPELSEYESGGHGIGCIVGAGQ